MKILNLHKCPSFLVGRAECWALEKIHGTSAHVTWDGAGIRFFAGGVKHDEFVKLFDRDALVTKFAALDLTPCTVYGEAYGGSCQGMKDTYGDKLRFVAFDVKFMDLWLAVPQAVAVVHALGLEYVDYARVSATLAAVDAERDRDSVQAVRNGCGPGKQREGVVLRPINEEVDAKGARVIFKHKSASFCETKRPRAVSLDEVEVLRGAQAIADEWVTARRLEHVLDHLRAAGKACVDLTDTGHVVREMHADVTVEAGAEVVWSPEARRSVGTAAAKLYKAYLASQAA